MDVRSFYHLFCTGFGGFPKFYCQIKYWRYWFLPQFCIIIKLHHVLSSLSKRNATRQNYICVCVCSHERTTHLIIYNFTLKKKWPQHITTPPYISSLFIESYSNPNCSSSSIHYPISISFISCIFYQELHWIQHEQPWSKSASR